MSTTTLSAPATLSSDDLAQFERDGYFIARGLFSPEETANLTRHFMEIQQSALDPANPLREKYQPRTAADSKGDILQQFPRIMQPARWDELSRAYMLDTRLEGILRDLLQEEPLAAQSMLYFKPSGARGQALHQDNFYLNVTPGTCMAAWAALDRADAENGGLFVVPGSHKLSVLCPHMADMDKSFTTEEVTIPEGMDTVQIVLEAGDVLFFNGSVIHGSTPNTSPNGFRRSFICHYVGESTVSLSGGYNPLYSFQGDIQSREGVGILNTCGAEDWETYTRLRQEWETRYNQLVAVGNH